MNDFIPCKCKFSWCLLFLSLITSVLNMRGTTHSNKLIGYFDTVEAVATATTTSVVAPHHTTMFGLLSHAIVFKRLYFNSIQCSYSKTTPDNRILFKLEILIVTNWSMFRHKIRKKNQITNNWLVHVIHTEPAWKHEWKINYNFWRVWCKQPSCSSTDEVFLHRRKKIWPLGIRKRNSKPFQIIIVCFASQPFLQSHN